MSKKKHDCFIELMVFAKILKEIYIHVFTYIFMVETVYLFVATK